jgi:unsaturated chondroitin disaccharide hydrolase
MKKWLFALSLGAGFVNAYADLDSLVQSAKEYALEQVVITKGQVSNGSFARFAGADGKWQSVAANDWTAGFYPGYLWLAYELSNDPKIKDWAEQATAPLASQQFEKGTHDIGFAINTSFGNGLRLTGNVTYREICDTAARSLSTRYNAKVGAVRSWSFAPWDNTFAVITDNMVNLEILYVGAKNGGQAEWATYATNHASRTANDHIRSDGSTIHLVSYDQNSGTLLKKQNFYPGLTDNSTWACGQAWALYGFTMAYRESQNDSLLHSAQKLADWYLKNLPADGVPYWDFSPQQKGFRDVAAGVIALAAILELSTLVDTDSLRLRYFDEASKIMATLCGANYLSKGKNVAGILLHGHGDADNETDVSLIYADYYFLQSILRYEAYKKRYTEIPVKLFQEKNTHSIGALPKEMRYNLKGQSLR